MKGMKRTVLELVLYTWVRCEGLFGEVRCESSETSYSQKKNPRPVSQVGVL